MVKTIVAIAIVYLIAVVGWITLAGTISYRTDHQDADLKHEVGQLWGTPLEQNAPAASLGVDGQVETEKWDASQKRRIVERTTVIDKYDLPIIENGILNWTKGKKDCCGTRPTECVSQATTFSRTLRTRAAG